MVRGVRKSCRCFQFAQYMSTKLAWLLSVGVYYKYHSPYTCIILSFIMFENMKFIYQRERGIPTLQLEKQVGKILWRVLSSVLMMAGNVPPKRWLTFTGLYGITRSQDSAVSIATGYGLDDRVVEVRVPVGSRIFSSPRRPDRLWGPPNLLSNGYRGLGREADHSPATSAEVKKTWVYTSTPPYAFMA
jgi:hypothetical protein